MTTVISSKAKRRLTIDRLRILRQIELNNSCSKGFRFYLDRILGGYHFYEGALPTNWRSTPKKLRELILKSTAVRELEVGSMLKKELGSLIVLEHAYTLKELTLLVIEEKFEQAIDAYDVRFITKEEDARLRRAEAQGFRHTSRYDIAGIVF